VPERKPPGTGFSSWVDQQIADGEKRGLFDDLPGAGKPIPDRGSEADYGQAWMRDYARRQGVPEEELLPPPLKLRKEIERLTDAVHAMDTEQEVRDIAAELNRRIVAWRRIPVGPAVHVPLVDQEMLVSRWRDSHPAKPAPLPADSARPAADAEPARPGWWRRLRRGRH
jgi:hypothetical protein